MYFKVFFAVFIICCSINFCIGSIATFGVQKSKDHEGFCDYKGDLVKRGNVEMFKTPYCKQLYCDDDYVMTIFE
jgi:hypothetical protein